MKSMPGWVKKRWSSAATKACEHALGHGGHRHEDALLLGVFGEQPAVGGVEPRDGRRLVVGQLLVVGQAVAEMPEQAGHGADAYDQAGQAKGQTDFDKIEHDHRLSKGWHGVMPFLGQLPPSRGKSRVVPTGAEPLG